MKKKTKAKRPKKSVKKASKPKAPKTVRVDDVIDRGTYSRPFPTQERSKT
jgi:hypothetical protein